MHDFINIRQKFNSNLFLYGQKKFGRGGNRTFDSRGSRLLNLPDRIVNHLQYTKSRPDFFHFTAQTGYNLLVV